MWHELCVEHSLATRFPCDERLRGIRLDALLCKRPLIYAERLRRTQQLRDCFALLLLVAVVLVLLSLSHHKHHPLSTLPFLSFLSLRVSLSTDGEKERAMSIDFESVSLFYLLSSFTKVVGLWFKVTMSSWPFLTALTFQILTRDFDFQTPFFNFCLHAYFNMKILLSFYCNA